MQQETGKWSRSAIIAFVVTLVAVAAMHVMHVYGYFGDAAIRWSLIGGILGLIVLNIAVFSISLLNGLWGLKQKEKVAGSPLEEDEVEREMAPVLQGQRVILPHGVTVVRVVMGVCLGMIVGAIVGMIISHNIAAAK